MKKGLCAVSALALSFPVFSALNDLDNGLVNDTVLNITWLKDANMVKTSCDANNGLWEAFTPINFPIYPARTKSDICNRDNGRLNQSEAQSWVSIMNSQNYLGYNDWRLPVMTESDPSCSKAGWGYRCTGSEMGHLNNSAPPVGLGNPNWLDDDCYNPPITDPLHCLQNSSPFTNLHVDEFYYYSNPVASVSNDYWVFSFGSGFQGITGIENFQYVWPVRTGQSGESSTTDKALLYWITRQRYYGS